MEPSPRSPGLRLALRVALAALVVLLLAVFAFGVIFSRAEVEPKAVEATAPREGEMAVEPPPDPAEPSAEAGQAIVASVSGKVERSSAGGAWALVRTGERLLERDAIRTAANGGARLQLGEQSTLTLGGSSELGVRQASKDAHGFKLVRGQVAVDHRPELGRTLRIEGEDGQAVASTGGARFSVLASGGTLAVATRTGTVNLEAAGATVAVGGGEQSVARGGRPPSAAAAIPVKLLLKLATEAGQGCPSVRGVAQEGTEVTVDGRAVATDADGRFVIRGPADGRAALQVRLRHVSGRTETRRIDCSGPSSDVDLSIRWKGTP